MRIIYIPYKVQQKRYRRKLRSKNNKKTVILQNTNPSSYIEAPEVFTIGNHKERRPFLIFIEKIKNSVKSIDKNVILTIDFTKSKYCVPSATLLLFAEIDRLINFNGVSNLKGIPPKDSKSHQAFTQIGLCEKLNMIANNDINHTMAKYWRSVSSTKDNDENTQKHFKYLKQELIKSSEIESTLWEVIIEATGNSIDHAYEHKRGDGFVDTQRWWMFSQVNQDNKTFGLAICDLGIGIPKSLPAKYPREKLRGYLENAGLVKGINDATLIRASVEIARSRKEKNAGRGHGMQYMHSIIDQLNEGTLNIYSNHGSYKYSPENGGTCYLKKHKYSVAGTIVEWHIPIKKEDECVEGN